MSTEEYDIKQLLDRYWAAETSLEEERTLREEKTGGSETSSADPLFDYFSAQKKVHLPTAIPLPYQQKAKVISLQRRIWVAAACAVVLLGSFFLVVSDRTDPLSSEADLAYQEVTEALFFISDKMNSGLVTVDASLQKVEPLNDIFN